MDTDTEFLENIKACRTCGIHYVTPSQHQLKHLFQSPPENSSEIMLIRLELTQWNIEVAEDDGYPQYVCNTCIHKFAQVFELRSACINAQNEFRKFYNVPNGNLANIKIKTEKPDDENEEQTICDFIYVDDLSDTEYDGATPFNIPHVPIKEEVIEAATIPMEETQHASNLVESAAEVVKQTMPSSASSPSSQIAQLVLQNESVSEIIPMAQQQEVECKLCQHLSPGPEEHKQHMQRAHEIRDMDCHICGKQFKNSTPARLKFHMKWHTLNKHVKCTLCGFVCSSKEALKEHKRANHGKINCNICGKGVLAKKMKSHLRQHELLTKYSCEYCTAVFSTEHDRENHIWQIHANEDDTHVTHSATNIQTDQAPGSQEQSHDNIYGEQEQEEQMLCQEPEDDIINYKFLCAHCNLGFMEQIELETHVNEEHRAKTLMAAAENESLGHNEESIRDESVKVAAPQHDDVDHTNITVFEDYDNDTDIHDSVNEDLLHHTPSQTQNINTSFVTQTEHMDHEEEAPHQEDTNETIEDYHTETALNNPTTDDEEQEEDEEENEDATNSAEEEESNSHMPPYNDNSFNTFACAKCSETFATIEQLRQHYDQHLADEQQQQQSPTKTTPSKSQFKCNLCGKSFDLKFSLNRHVKKHKNAPV